MALRADNFIDELGWRGVDIHAANGGQDLHLIGHGLHGITLAEWDWIKRNKPILLKKLADPMAVPTASDAGNQGY